ncbi:MAG TPA: hypothetical protein VHX68_13655 [Planctomycetaceae bacterium]|jgi:hypothetical protein|nr:hypothetical protein [Planctomycetaceae bacterium]
MQLDAITPQADVVDRNGRLTESHGESEAINIKANRLRQVAGAKNRLNLSERCPRHKSLIVRLRADESSPFRNRPRYPSTASPVQAMQSVSCLPVLPGSILRAFCSAIAALARPDYIRAVELGTGELASGRDEIDDLYCGGGPRTRHSEAGSVMASSRVSQDVRSVIAGEAS